MTEDPSQTPATQSKHLQNHLEEWFKSYCELAGEEDDSVAASSVEIDPELSGRISRAVNCAMLLDAVWGDGDGGTEDDDGSTRKESRPQADSKVLPSKFGRFEIRRELGRGGNGIVFLAYDPQVRREIALKIPQPGMFVNSTLRDRFLREAQAAGSLDHPNVVPIYESGEVHTVCYIASSYCPGPTLRNWLRKLEAPVPCRLAAELVSRLAAATHHAHSRGILHRDLKSSNVLLHPIEEAHGASPLSDGFGFVPKISDFGLARFTHDQADLTLSGAVMGTAAYMAPEQAGGQQDRISVATDVYSLGAILYELLTGQTPFGEGDFVEVLQKVRHEEPARVQTLRSEIPRDLAAICMQCLRKDPAKRYATAGELRDDLERFLNGEPTIARPLPTAAKVWRWMRRYPAAATSAASVIVAGAISLVGLAVYNDNLRLLVRQLDHTNTRLEQALAETMQAEQRAIDASWIRVAVSSDGRWGAVSRGARQGAPCEVLLWDMQSGGLRKQWRISDDPSDQISGLSFSPDGRLLSVVVPQASDRDGLRIFEIPSGRRVDGPRLDCSLAKFSPAGGLIAFEDGDAVGIWSITEGKRTATLAAHGGEVNDLAFSSNSSLLATCGKDRVVRVWRVDTGELAHKLVGHQAEVRKVAFAEDGGSLISASLDGRIRVWQAATGKLLLEFDSIPDVVAQGPKTRADRRFAFVDADGKVVVLDAQ